MSDSATVSRTAVALRRNCPVCESSLDPFFELAGVPASSCALVESRREALDFPRGDVLLGLCRRCGFIGNLAFEPHLAESLHRYEETQAFSGTFSRFHRELATDLVSRLSLRERSIVEIGCGKGEFLALLCSLGGNRGIGFDPGFDEDRGVIGPGIDATVVRELFDERTDVPAADFLCCKMTLEHVPDPARFVRATRRVLRPSGQSTAYFLVPEALRILSSCAFEDIYYEHCNYFTPGSLARLFRSQGFDVNRLEVTYAGQYLAAEVGLQGSSPASGTDPLEDGVEVIARLVDTFSDRYYDRREYWRSRVSGLAAQGPVLLWGSGSKAVSFLHALTMPDAIDAVVDINPYRQGCFMPGTGQRIIAPGDVAGIAPRAVIAMNAVYISEIGQQLFDLGVHGELLAL